MSTRAYCDNPEPHGAHDWSRLAGGYVHDHELLPSYDSHWCAGIKDVEILRQWIFLRNGIREQLATVEAKLAETAKLWQLHADGMYCSSCQEPLLSDGVIKFRDGTDVVEATRCCEVELDRYPFTDL